MPIIPFLYSIFQAIAAVPALVSGCEQFASALTLWLVQRSNNETMQKIADAASLQAHAQSDADRYTAAQAWQAALSRPRSSVN